MANQEWKATISYIRLDMDAKDWMVKEANKKGVPISDYIGNMVEEKYQMSTNAQRPEDSSMCDVWDHYYFRQREKKLNRVKYAATQYLSDPDDESRLVLEGMCERIGKDLDEIVSEIEDNPFAAVVAKERSDSKRGECIMWLSEFLTKNDGEVDASSVYEIAKVKGFSSSTLNRAKGDINSDSETPMIESGRDGTRHIWRMVEH